MEHAAQQLALCMLRGAWKWSSIREGYAILGLQLCMEAIDPSDSTALQAQCAVRLEMQLLNSYNISTVPASSHGHRTSSERAHGQAGCYCLCADCFVLMCTIQHHMHKHETQQQLVTNLMIPTYQVNICWQQPFPNQQ